MPRFHSQSQFQPAAHLRGVLRDITWGRVIFRAPELENPRAIFDPLPFRYRLAPITRSNTARR